MYRQLSNKDCAVTVTAHVTGLSYTSIVNRLPDYRFMRSRTRSRRERADRVVGRAVLFGRTFKRGDVGYRTAFYNDRYRVEKHPYFCHFGLSDKDYLPIVESCGYKILAKENCTLDDLRYVRFAVIAVPSINVKSSSHLIVWRDGRIWDPSPYKRYDFSKLRRAKRMRLMALCRDQDEYDALRRNLDVELTGREIMVRLVWRGMDLLERGIDPKTLPPSAVIDLFKLPRHPTDLESRLLAITSQL